MRLEFSDGDVNVSVENGLSNDVVLAVYDEASELKAILSGFDAGRLAGALEMIVSHGADMAEQEEPEEE